jgi:L-ascorbate metabolism protein UlaG (beta-lactamase superfamily)
MELIRHGHACFSVRDHLDRIWLFDPYRPDGLGGRFNLPLPSISPQGIFSTHSHEDHAWRSYAWKDVPFHERDFQCEDLQMTCRTVAHDSDEGGRMGFSRVMRLELKSQHGEKIVIVHAGDASDVDDPSLQEHCASADVLILPAGGTFTMGPKEAAKLARMAQAHCTIFTHFREPGIDLPMLTPDEAFEALDLPISRVESGSLQLPLPDGTPPFVWLKAQMSPAIEAGLS